MMMMMMMMMMIPMMMKKKEKKEMHIYSIHIYSIHIYSINFKITHLYAQCCRSSGAGLRHQGVTSFYEESQEALTANDFNQIQVFSSQRQGISFQLQLCESANFLSSNESKTSIPLA